MARHERVFDTFTLPVPQVRGLIAESVRMRRLEAVRTASKVAERALRRLEGTPTPDATLLHEAFSALMREHESMLAWLEGA
jgi:hypothetical protein